MKLKSLVIAVIFSILTISAAYADNRYFKVYYPDYNDEAKLLDWCKQYAKALGYDESLIVEAHFVTLPEHTIGYTYKKDNGHIILVSRTYTFPNKYAFDENLVHEICHIYTKNDIEWHIAMVEAVNKVPWLESWILRDEKTDHPLE